jgi:hypothetical protein
MAKYSPNGIPSNGHTNSNKGIDNLGQTSYISKAVEGNSDAETVKAAPKASSKTLNLDNYIV